MDVLQGISLYTGVHVESILSRSRRKEIVEVRQFAIFECFRLGYGSLNAIAKMFNFKDHTAALYVIKKVSKKCTTDSEYLFRLLKIRAHGKY